MDAPSTASTSSADLYPHDALRVQILAYDSYQTSPSAIDKSHSTSRTHDGEETVLSHRPFTQVPVIRLFGKVATGHTVVLNVHNVFPCVYIEYDGSLKRHDARLRLRQLKLEIEKQLFLSFKRQKLRRTGQAGLDEDNDDAPDVFNDYGSDVSDISDASLYENRYVSSVDLIKSVPFYGYHVGVRPYVKIAILNPRYVTRLCTILRQRKVHGKVYQPYEAHIPYLLHFLADYNLYSCDWLYLDRFLWRSPIVGTLDLGALNDDDDFQYTAEELQIFNSMRINDDLKAFLAQNVKRIGSGAAADALNVLPPDEFPRVGTALLEMDCVPQWILNRSTLSTRDLHHDFLEVANPALSAHSESFVASTRHILKDIAHQRRIRNLDHDSFFSKLSLMHDDDVRDHDGTTDWIEQAELDDMLRHCIDLSNELYRRSAPPEFQGFVKHPADLESLQTPHQNIDAAFRNVQWAKLGLLTDLDLADPLSGVSSQSYSSSRNAPLPSSMFESNSSVSDRDFEVQDEQNDVEEDDGGDNWMRSVPPHKAVDSIDEDTSMATDPDLDRADLEAFNHSKPRNARLSLIESDQVIFSQLTRQRSSKELLRPKSSVSIRTAASVGGTFEFRGTRGLPVNDRSFSDSFEELGLLAVDYDDPFYSELADAPTGPFFFAGKKFDLKSHHHSQLPKVTVNYSSPSSLLFSSLSNPAHLGGTYEFMAPLPSAQEVTEWLHDNVGAEASKSQLFKSQILLQTPTLKYGFKYPSAQSKYKRKKNDYNKMINFALEIHVNTRGDLKPDPEKDEISAICWSFDASSYPFELDISESGVLVLDSDSSDGDAGRKYIGTTDFPVAVFSSEVSMVRELVSLVKLIDPDLLSGYEIHAKSWGFLIERFRKVYDIDLCSKLSRASFKSNDKFGDRWGYTHASAIKITGRHMVNLWRILRGELNLLRYSLENVSFHALHRRIPHYSEQQLTEWFQSGVPTNISTVLNYYLSRVRLSFDIIERLEIISKTTEQSRLIGIDFYSVFYRGSQFKVESFLIRLTKAENFMLISPSKEQVFKADALQCIPLVMEPTSAFYKSPLVVLDFQSLYPSIVIAYNYCYSTLLGRLRGYDPKVSQTIGVGKNKLQPGLLELLKDDITISPNGMMFAKSRIRKSLLAKMLTEILETRFAAKETMKSFQDDHELTRLYNSRQLALKLLANVTYGYTSATFSGRMPCSDIADAIVSSGRETLNRAVKEIESNEKWAAKVVYGDTDSLFVYLPGKSRDDAFRIGKEMAQKITSINPKPVKLQFEKVYHPCVLLSKKRYVGYSYQHEKQQKPSFDAKGIETVRRDGIPAQQKMVEKSLRILFETSDLSQVKSYVQDQFLKIMSNKVSIQDFCFAKEVRIGTYKDERYAPAGAHVSKRLMEADERAEPQYKERVPYVVVQSYKGERLRDRCVTPQYFLENEVTENLQLDTEYYITKTLIPPLERIFNLIGVDVKAWYRDMPRALNYLANYEDRDPKRRKHNNTLHPFLKASVCTLCLKRTGGGRKLCSDCLKDELNTVLTFQLKVSRAQQDLKRLLMICRSCTAGFSSKSSNSLEMAHKCTSDDCPIYYSRLKAGRKMNTVQVREGALLADLNDW